jgi:myo-inositol-1(or 4)-monophosphatase
LPDPDLEILIDAARSAGEIALGFWRGENRVWDKGSDDPVSEADLAVEDYLHRRLTAARPGVAWLSEEAEDDPARHDAEEVFVVDPIDGTRSFIAGESAWAHSIALVRNGRPVAGVVHMPAKDRLYVARVGEGATVNGVAIRATTRQTAEGATVLAARPTFQAQYWPGGVPDVTRAFRPSLAYRLCLVAEGRFDAMVTLRDCWEWDIAAGALIAAEAGAVASDRSGATLAFNRPDRKTRGAVVAGSGVHVGLMAGLSR